MPLSYLFSFLVILIGFFIYSLLDRDRFDSWYLLLKVDAFIFFLVETFKVFIRISKCVLLQVFKDNCNLSLKKHYWWWYKAFFLVSIFCTTYTFFSRDALYSLSNILLSPTSKSLYTVPYSKMILDKYIWFSSVILKFLVPVV